MGRQSPRGLCAGDGRAVQLGPFAGGRSTLAARMQTAGADPRGPPRHDVGRSSSSCRRSCPRCPSTTPPGPFEQRAACPRQGGAQLLERRPGGLIITQARIESMRGVAVGTKGRRAGQRRVATVSELCFGWEADVGGPVATSVGSHLWRTSVSTQEQLTPTRGRTPPIHIVAGPPPMGSRIAAPPTGSAPRMRSVPRMGSRPPLGSPQSMRSGRPSASPQPMGLGERMGPPTRIASPHRHVGRRRTAGSRRAAFARTSPRTLLWALGTP